MPDLPDRREHIPSRSSLAQVALWLAVGLALSALFLPTLAWLGRSWSIHPYYSHGIALPLVAAWFAWRARRSFLGSSGRDWGLAVVAGGTVIHLAAMRWQAHPVSAAALLVILLGLAILVGGTRALRGATYPIALLGLAIPLPFVERLAPPLAGVLARGAVLAAGAIGVGAVQVGAQLVVADGQFAVGAPCSGLRSLLVLSTIAVIIAGLADGPIASRAALITLAVPFALLANWLRLTGFLWLADVSGTKAALTLYHGVASPLLIVAATVALLAVGVALGCEVRARE